MHTFPCFWGYNVSSGTDDGDKSEQDLSEEYPVEEMEALGNRKKSANQVRLPQ